MFDLDRRRVLVGAAAAGAALTWRPGIPAAAGPQHGLAMHGTLKYPAGFTQFDYVNPQAPKGGVLRQGAFGTFDSFNPFVVKGTPIATGAIYDTLLTNSADEAFSEYGLLAKSVEMPDDRSFVEFTLDARARWHDGRTISVDDVIWTFETLRSKGRPIYRLYYRDVAKIEQTGERRVRFTFGQTNRELPLILGQFTVLPKHWWATRTFEEATLEPPLGSGPFKIGKFEAGRFLEFERVPDYWGRDLPVRRGLSNFDIERVEFFRDQGVLVEAVKGGQLDLRVENSAKTWATSYEIDALKDGLLVKREFKHSRPSGMQGFVLNQRREIFQDRRVREALTLCFDFEWANANLFYGAYFRTRSYFDNSELAATGLPRGEELKILEGFRGKIPDEVFTKEYNPPKSDGSGADRANLRRAVELLRAAGWVVKERKLQNAAGQPMRFEILIDSSGPWERIVNPYVESLKRIGIDASVRAADQVQYQRRNDTFDFDIVVDVWGASLSPGNEQRNAWSSTAARQPGSQNTVGLADPVVDALVELVIAAPDRDALVQRTRALDRVLQWGFWVVPHWHNRGDRVVYWDLFGRPETVPMQGVQLDAWWFDRARADAVRAKRPQGRG